MWVDPESIKRVKMKFKDMTIPKTITLPILRNVYPKLIAQELVSVQPMTAPAFGESIEKLLYPEVEVEPIEFFTEEEFNL